MFAVATCAIFHDVANCEEIPMETLSVTCAFYQEGEDIPEVIPVVLPLNASTKEGAEFPSDYSWGSGTLMTSEHGKEGCHGYKYPYRKISIDSSWQELVKIDGEDVLLFQFNNKAWWDWYYTGYAGPDSCDYTTNCHGHSFMVGDWVEYLDFLLYYNGYSPSTQDFGGFEHDPGMEPEDLPKCYEEAQTKDAEVALTFAHSVKVTGGECENDPEITGVECFSMILPGLETDETCTFHVIKESSEQFRESGTYTQSATCSDTPPSVKVVKAHKRAYDLRAQLMNGLTGNPLVNPYGSFSNNGLLKKTGDDEDAGTGGCGCNGSGLIP